MNQAELQQGLQRVASNFISRLGQAAVEVSKNADPETRVGILRHVLLNESSVLDIATGPVPETNLLDMIAFAELSRRAVEEYWVPKTLGEKGRPFLAPFQQLPQDVWQLGNRVLSEQQKAELLGIIDEWQRKNPDQVRVADVRLPDFAGVAGDISAQRAKEAHGLLGSVKSATQTADQALLLGERGMFLMQRLPFLIRAHVRLGSQETVEDVLPLVVSQTQSLIDESEKLRPLLADTASMLKQVQELMRQAKELAPLLERATGLIESGKLQDTLAATERLTDRTLKILHELQTMVPKNPPTIAEVRKQADELVRRWILYLFAAGAGLIVLFWCGYYVAKRLVAHL